MTEPIQETEATGWTLTAGGGPLAPPRQAFEDPQFTGPAPMAVSPAGYVKGHIANWDVCHTGFTDVCVLAPHSKTSYGKFHQGTVVTSEGDQVRIGKITMAGGHASPGHGMQAAVAHYDNSTTAAAIGRVGEDEHGIWFAGALVPGLTDIQVAELRRSPISGDWRWDQQAKNLELIAALAVNTPGFPIAASAANGEQLSLVAAGIVLEQQSLTADGDQDQETVSAAAEVPAVDESVKTARIERLAALVAVDQMRLKDRISKFVPFGER